MADFHKFYPTLKVEEGGYASEAYALKKKDSGGRTYLGIAENYNKTWEGWPLIDAWIKIHGEPKWNQKIPSDAIYAAAEKHTKVAYWDKLFLDQINNQSLAEQIFDFGFNSGLGLSAKFVQRIIGHSETTVFNSNDIAGINIFDQEKLFNTLKNMRVDMIKKSTIINPDSKPALIARASKFIFKNNV